MDNNDSNLKPSSTGGLKLMTVFIAVLALHVLVIGGFTVYHLMSGGSSDADLALDKGHKGFKIGADGSVITDAPLADANAADKSATAPITSTEVSSPPVTASTPTPEQNAAPETTAPTVAATPASGSTATPPATTTAANSNEPVTTTSTPMTGPVNPGTATSSMTSSTPSAAPVAGTSSTPSAPAPTSPSPAKSELATTSPSLAPPPEPAPAVEPAPAPAPYVGPVKMPPAPTEVAHAEKPHVIYTVKITDSYRKIAHAHHITVAQLKEANGIKNNVLHTGQRLIIPTRDAEAVAETTSSLDSAPTGPILANSTTSSTDVLSSEPTATTEPVAAHHHHHLYTVVKGDTLTKIARKFKTTPAALMQANDITNPTKLTIGKKLKIPREARSAKNSEPATDQPAQVQARTATTAQLANYVH